MSESFGDLLPAMRPLIPRALIDDVWLARLSERLAHLPGLAAAHLIALELRLGDPVPAADLAVPIGPGNPLTPFFIRRGETSAADSPAVALGRLLATMQADGYAGSFTGGFLEYDIAEVPPDQRPEPAVFLSLRPEVARSCSADALVQELTEAIGWEDRSVAEVLAQVIGALPPRGGIYQIGAMLGRELQAVKVLASVGGNEDITHFLDKAGWSGSIENVQRAMDDMSSTTARFALSIDMTAQGLLPRLGLEIYPADLGKGVAAWRPIVERVAELGLCLAEKKRGLLTFPGIERLFGSDGVFVLYRGISHLKLTVHGTGLQSKAYIGFKYVPLSVALSASDAALPFTRITD